jgi:hypothetical protein
MLAGYPTLNSPLILTGFKAKFPKAARQFTSADAPCRLWQWERYAQHFCRHSGGLPTFNQAYGLKFELQRVFASGLPIDFLAHFGFANV